MSRKQRLLTTMRLDPRIRKGLKKVAFIYGVEWRIVNAALLRFLVQTPEDQHKTIIQFNEFEKDTKACI